MNSVKKHALIYDTAHRNINKKNFCLKLYLANEKQIDRLLLKLMIASDTL